MMFHKNTIIMKYVKLLSCLFLAVASVLSVSAQSKKYDNEGLENAYVPLTKQDIKEILMASL